MLFRSRSRYYHTPFDTPSSLHYDKLERNAAYLLDLTLGAANDLAWIDNYDQDARDQKVDLAGVANLLGGVLKQPPQDIRGDTLNSLHKDRFIIAKFYDQSDPLSWFVYRRLHIISLRVQCSAARPCCKIRHLL